MRSYRIIGYVTHPSQPQLKFDITINANSSLDATKLARGLYGFGGGGKVAIPSVNEVKPKP